MADNSATVWVAIYGAVLSSGLFGWTLYRDFRDRGKIDVTATIGTIVVLGVGVKPENQLVITLTNSGRRSIVPKMVVGRSRDKKLFFRFDQLPRRLEPGDFLSLEAEDLSALEMGLIRLSVLDTTGKEHRMSEKALRSLLSDYRELDSNDPPQ